VTIVGRGLGRPAAGAIVAFGLGITVNVTPPVVVIDETAVDVWTEPGIDWWAEPSAPVGVELERISGGDDRIAWWSEPATLGTAETQQVMVWSEPGPDRWTEPSCPADNGGLIDEWSEPT